MTYSIILSGGENMIDQSMLTNLKNELRRGTQVLAVLSQLDKTQYGYSLLQDLEDKKVNIEAGTLYPLLRRLESQGLLKSEWDTTESRPRKYYLLSEDGKEVYQLLLNEWNTIAKEMSNLFEGEK
jgi:DNA-binding PadR family transcriptional regulator